MANKQQQFAIQKQISSHVNKNHLTRTPSFSDCKNAASSLSMLKDLTQKPQVKTKQPTQCPSFRDWKDAADSFAMLINMTNKPQEPYSSEVPSPKRLTVDSEVWLLPRKPEPPSSDQPFPRRPTANSEPWLRTRKPVKIMQASTKNPNQRHSPPTSGEEQGGYGGSRPHQFFELESSSSELPFPKRPTPDSEVWLQPRKPIMQASTKNANQRCAPPISGEDHAGCGGSRPYQFFEHEPSSSEKPLPKHSTSDSEVWLGPRKPIMQAPTKNPNQRPATPTSGEDQGGCGGSRRHQVFEFEPSSSEQPVPRSTPNSLTWQGPRKPEPKPPSSEQQFSKRPTVNSEAWSGPRKQETSSSKQPFPKYPAVNSEAWLRARNPVPFPSQIPNQLREIPPSSPQPNSNSRPTNNFPNPNSRPSNTFPSKFLPGMKRKASDTDIKYRPAPQPPIDYITDIIKRSVDDYFCKLCQVNSSSALTLRQHLGGKKHRNNVKYCQQKMICHEGGKGIHGCEICHIYCTDRRSLTMHLKGKKHLDRLQKVQNGKVGVQKAIRCELCMANCMNEDCFNEHILGKQHAVQLELASRGII